MLLLFRVASCFLAFIFFLVAADAGVITVTRLDDRNVGCSGGDCSLREALAFAATQAGDDTIAFNVPTPAVITLTEGEIAVGSNVTINGLGADALTVSGNGQTRIFAIGGGTTVTINNLTLTGGNGIGESGVVQGGGAIRAGGTQLTLDTVRLLDNDANSTVGGGVYSSVGALTVLNSTFSRNIAQVGGAIYHTGTTLKVQSSTFNGNVSLHKNDPDGGGAIHTEQTTVISNSTFSGNFSDYAGGGVFYLGESIKTLTVRNCTFTGNFATKYGGGLINLADGGGKVANNIISLNGAAQFPDYYDGGAIAEVTNYTGAAPSLGPLLDRGGVTPTHGLLSDSPALDAGTNAEALDVNGNPLTTDQRGAGFPRSLDGPDVDNIAKVDIGAYEGVIPPNLPPVNSVPGNQAIDEGSVRTFSAANSNLIFVSDADAHSNPIQVTLTATNGVVTLSGTSGLTFVSGDGTGDATMSFAGSITDINKALNSLAITPYTNFSGGATLQIVTNDLGHTGTGGALEDSDVINITVNAINTPPINSVPGAQNAVTGTPLVFSAANGNAISISDLDAGGSPVSVTLAAINGTISLASTSGLSFSTGTGTSDATMAFTGNIADINSALDGLTFQPNSGVTGPASLQITTDDQGNTGSGGALSDSDTINITISSAPPTPTPTPTAAATPTLLANISTRLRVETGDNVLIGGFIITGNDQKRLIIRAIGPSLPVPDALADPVLEVYDIGGNLIASNDNWVDSPDKQAIIDSTVPPGNDFESAVIGSAAPGAYTAIVRGLNGTTGVGLVEVYDLSLAADAKLANISTRGFVQTDDNVLIGGLIVFGQDPLKVIVRAIGPSLPVAGALADPTLELHDVNGGLIAFDDDWRTGGQEAEIIATTVPPSNDVESAIVGNLSPGNYTAIVRGKGNSTGVGLVEVYALQ